MSNEIFKIGDVVEVMPSHAQTWKNSGKIAIGHRFIIKNTERWNNANRRDIACPQDAPQKFGQNYHPKDLKIVERDGKPYIDERWNNGQWAKETATFSKFNIGDAVETCAGGWFFCEPKSAKYFINDTFNTSNYAYPKKIIEIIQSEDGMYWYMLNDCGNYISDDNACRKKEEPKIHLSL